MGTAVGGAQNTGANTADGVPGSELWADGTITVTPGSRFDTDRSDFNAANGANLSADNDQINLNGQVAALRAGTTGTHQLCAHTQVDYNYADFEPWSKITPGRQFCLSYGPNGEVGLSLLTVTEVNGKAATIRVQTWSCPNADCWHADN
jgi:hypothetical protein